MHTKAGFMKKKHRAPDPLTIDLSNSLGYQLYGLPSIWKQSSSDYPYAEKFYVLHLRSLRCQIYEYKSFSTLDKTIP
jgi:hypothetical protein